LNANIELMIQERTHMQMKKQLNFLRAIWVK